MSPTTCPCAEKIQLVAEYGAAVAAYYAAVGELEQGMISGSAEVFRQRYRATEDVRAMCEVARTVLNDHVANHGC